MDQSLKSGPLRLCRSCRRSFETSPKGSRWRSWQAQERAKGNDPPEWPSTLYHAGGTELCPRHLHLRQEQLQAVYGERDTVVLALGFSSYARYLKSPLWKAIRAKTFANFGRVCFWCGSKAEQVHHSSYTYETMKGLDISPLYPICRSCHAESEYFRDGTKRTPEEATRWLKHNRGRRGLKERRRLRRKVLTNLYEQSEITEKALTEPVPVQPQMNPVTRIRTSLGAVQTSM